MPTRPTLKLFCMLSIMVCLLAAPQSYAQQPKSHKRATKKQAVEPAPQLAPAPAPLTPEQLPSTPPQVAYQDNQLTIAAQNSTLGDILRAVHAQTGAVVEIPANANERVVAHYGPGPARDVLAALLNGSHFDYVMLGSESDPGAVEHVILTSRTVSAPDNSNAFQPAQPTAQLVPVPQPAVVQPPPQEAADDASEDDFGNDADNDDDQNAADNSVPAQEQPLLPNGQPGGRTPEQLLQELQRQQQLLQQQQGQGGQPNPQQPPGYPPAGQQPPGPPQ